MVGLRERAKRYKAKKEAFKEDSVRDVWGITRRACSKKMQEILESESLATEYEESLFKSSGNIEEYKTKFRKDLIALRNEKTGFKEKIAKGQISAQQFALLSPEELFSEEQRKQNEELKKQELLNSINKEKIPKNINAVKDSVVSEKWGISTSAAAVDEFDDNE